MEIAILIFDGITALDAVGPYEVLSRIPNAKMKFVSLKSGLVRTENKILGLQADFSLEEVQTPDVILVPGGWGTNALVKDERLLNWVRTAHQNSQWTISVCTGSLILGAAGILNGLPATTHWSALEELTKYGARPVQQRVVKDGKVVTAAGVSAGIDMALSLASWIAGDEIAQAIQLSLEYDPQPPFQSGNPNQASAALVEKVLRVIYRNQTEPSTLGLGSSL